CLHSLISLTYPLSLHDALPIFGSRSGNPRGAGGGIWMTSLRDMGIHLPVVRSSTHSSASGKHVSARAERSSQHSSASAEHISDGPWLGNSRHRSSRTASPVVPVSLLALEPMTSHRD